MIISTVETREAIVASALRFPVKPTQGDGMRTATLSYLICRRQLFRSTDQAVCTPAAVCSPHSSTDCWRMMNFCILPVTVIGKASTNFQ